MARNNLDVCWSHRPLISEEGPVVSLTSHGVRLRKVHHVITCIGRGHLQPGRIVLWVEDAEIVASPPVALKRLIRRGLEIQMTPSYGPHTKYYPFARSVAHHINALVVADDDMMYGPHWLGDLWAAHNANGEVIHCHRAYDVGMVGSRLAPYNDWTFCTSTQPSHARFFTGVAGAVYPPGFLNALRREGERFRDCAPRADDVWLNVVAVRHGFRVAQVRNKIKEWPLVLGTQKVGLLRSNVLLAQNDIQLEASYCEVELRHVEADAKDHL